MKEIFSDMKSETIIVSTLFSKLSINIAPVSKFLDFR